MFYLLCSYLCKSMFYFRKPASEALPGISSGSVSSAQRESLLNLYAHGMAPYNRTAATAPITGPMMTTDA